MCQSQNSSPPGSSNAQPIKTYLNPLCKVVYQSCFFSSKLMSFLSRLCLIALAGPSNVILNWRGKSRQPSLFLILRGKHWVKCDVSCWSLHKYPFSGWGSSLLFLICWEFLSKMNVEFCYAFFPNLLRWSRSFSSFVCGYGEFCWLIFKVQTMYSFIGLTNICGQLFCPSIVLGDGDKTLTTGTVPTVRSSSILMSLGLWGGVQGSPASDPPACTTSVLKNVPPASPSWASGAEGGTAQLAPRTRWIGSSWLGEWRAGPAATAGWDSKPSPPDPSPLFLCPLHPSCLAFCTQPPP